jgi:hypothetical protein
VRDSLRKRSRNFGSRHLAPQAEVLGPVHDAHPAPADDLLDLVTGDLAPEVAVRVDGHRGA